MSAPDPLAEYRSAFWLTFAEDHGLVNEWNILPPESPVQLTSRDARLIGVNLPPTSLGMIVTGS